MARLGAQPRAPSLTGCAPSGIFSASLNPRATIFLALIAAFPLAQAQEPEVASVRNVYDYFVAGTTEQCNSVKEMEAALKPDADPLQAYTLKDSVQSLCVCMPAQLAVFRSTLTERDLSRHVTEAQFLVSIKPYVFDKCSADQMRAMYGSQCKKRFKLAGLDVDGYCGCMKKTMDGYTESQIAAIASEAADYVPKAAEAEIRGDPVPVRPQALEAYAQADQTCKGEGKQ